MPRVLVVDDEQALRVALGRGLTAEGLAVVLAADGPSGLRAAGTGHFDVIVLDVDLPGLSGYEVVQRLRALGVDTPVVLISTRSAAADRAAGLDLGADRYLLKPFPFIVLLAQVRALLRRRTVTHGGSVHSVRLGQLCLDPVTKQARWANQPFHLSPREFQLLYELACRPDTVLSRAELLDLVWGPGAVSPNAVEVYIGYLRRKLRTVGADHVLRTERHRGYQIRTDPPDATLTPSRDVR